MVYHFSMLHLSLLKRPFNTQGSICRHQHMLSILLFVAGVQFMLFVGHSFGLAYDSFFLTIPCYHFLIAQGIRRCRAMHKSGWFQFIPFSFVYMLIKETPLDEHKDLALRLSNSSTKNENDSCLFCQKHD